MQPVTTSGISEWPLLIYFFIKYTHHHFIRKLKEQSTTNRGLPPAASYILVYFYRSRLWFCMLGRFPLLRSDSWHCIQASFHLLVPCFSESASPKAALVQFMCLCITGWSTKKLLNSLVLLVPQDILNFTLKLVLSIQGRSQISVLAYEQHKQQKRYQENV